MLILVGTNHKYSPIDIREKIAFSKKGLKRALDFLSENTSLKAGFILSTCNRTEIYASAPESAEAAEEIKEFISRYHEISKEKLSPYLYVYSRKEALKHLLSVSSGLDSAVLGETQIFSQLKSAVYESKNANFFDAFLVDVFNSTVSFTKKLHRETKISEGKVSIASVAIDFIKEKMGSLKNKNILIIGVGKVTELALNCLKKEKGHVTFISNKTFEKAEALANQIGAKAVRFDELKEYLIKADVVISATSSPHYVIKKETLQRTEDGRRRTEDGKLLILDLALPRDVEPGIGEIKNVELFCLEDLDSVIRKNMLKKTKEAKKAKEIVELEAEKLWDKLTKSEPEPAALL